ncbi:MAG: metal-dependent hydrolase [Chloroflexaceae bacterium]
MNTPSHLILTAALGKRLRRTPVVRSAFLLGAVAPDLPLILLTIGGVVYYHYILGWEIGATFQYIFDDLFFNNPVWIALHNLFHGPTMLLLGLALVWPFRRRINSAFRWFYWFLLGCLLHSGIDVVTHVNDGPLLSFPFEWSIRFQSPISYWDYRYFGREFGIFETVLNIVLLGYLFGPPLYRRLAGWIACIRSPEECCDG